MTAVFLENPSSLGHETGGHPEQPARLIAIEHELEKHGWLGFDRVSSPAISREALTAVHPERHVAAIERFCEAGGGHLDLDTIASRESFEAALHSAGGAARMVELLLAGEASVGFSCHRPPGHHATADRAMGFCLFNNVAVAGVHALKHGGLSRVMIVDWDVHHGNGTDDIFHSDDRVLFVSIHQSPLYPGTGPAQDVGSGPGEGYTVNLPVAAGTGDDEYRSLVEHVAVPLAVAFAPQLLLISAGYDAHREDPLGGCEVTEAGFAAMTRSLRAVAGELEAPLGAVLEGGYALDALARSVATTMQALAAPESRRSGNQAQDLRLAPVALAARQRLARWWPALS
ncbi:MAG: histone deacetylase [Actinomycetota bacterium]|nr:histone deacetylase [Actinomycetota bacterium]